MGGLGGHMAHLSEDLELTFNDIVSILGNVASADIEAVTEKVDGQNLFLTVDEAGEIRAARNSGDIKKGGMTTAEYASKWAGHPAESAFTNGFAAISAALRRLSPETLSDIFAGGDRYVNMEIMYPGNPNIILYSAPQIVLHGLKYFGPLALKDRSELSDDERAELRDLATASAGGFPHLVRAVDGGQEQVGEELWTVNGPKIVALNKLADGTALAEVTEKIQSFAAPVGMDAQLRDYVELKVRNYASQVGLPEDRLDGLLKLMLDREAATDEGITVNSLKKGLPTELKSVVSTLGASTKSRKYIATILRPLEIAISDFAIEVLRGLKSYFVDEHDEEVIRMRDELQKSIVHLKALQSAGDENMGALIDNQLAKLGDIENVASTMEGVVFEYPVGSGRIYKLTGAFAMANQIIGRARRTGMTEELGNEFTIQISKDRQITKSLEEWMKEIDEINHKYQKPPEFVYNDILNGVPITEIVQQEFAQEMIYNTILRYTGILCLENEEEDADPVVDIEVVDESDGKLYALVPGSMKPPTLGHAGMIEAYSNMVSRMDPNGEVLVFVSKPTARDAETQELVSARGFPGRPEGITQTEAMEILKIMLPKEILEPMGNVHLEKTSHASPMHSVFDFVSPSEVEGKQAAPGDTVILGASTKGGDQKRWDGIINDPERYVRPGVTVESIAVDPVEHQEDYLTLIRSEAAQEIVEELPTITKERKKIGGPVPVADLPRVLSNISASDARHIMGFLGTDKREIAVQLLNAFFGEYTAEILAYLGLSGIVAADRPVVEPEAELEELSSGSGGGSYGAPGGYRKRRKTIRRENKQTVDDVIRLLMERGIMT